MVSRPNPNAPASVFNSWLAALCGGLFALGMTAGGQGLGAILGGCRWIGVTLPIHRQTWALINQPSLAFSTQNAAVGYWFGGVLLCFLATAFLIPLLPRPRGLTWELVIVQFSWMAAVVGLGWMVLLDPWDGHISRFLRLHDASPALVWLIPVLGAWAALIPTLRLLGLARGAHPQLTRSGRLLTVIIHLVVPTGAWVGVGLVLVSRFDSRVQGSLLEGLPAFEALWPPALAATLPMIAALILAWLAYPRPWIYHLDPIGLKSSLFLLVAGMVLVGLQLILGGPLASGKCRGVVWSHADGRNNVRPWVNPTSILGAKTLPGTLNGE